MVKHNKGRSPLSGYTTDQSDIAYSDVTKKNVNT